MPNILTCHTYPPHHAAGIWKMMGTLNGQQKGIVEERFKTVDKDLAKKGLAAGYRKAALDASASSSAAASSTQAPLSLRHSHDGPLPSAAAGGAGGGGSYYAAPGQLSNTAGLISLSAAAATQEASAGPRRPQEMQNSSSFSMQAAEPGPGSQHPSMLLTGPSGRGMAGAAAGAGSAVHMTPQGMSVNIPDQATAAGLLSAPTSATAGPPKYQPLQSFSGPSEIYAEWDKCLAVLQDGEGAGCRLQLFEPSNSSTWAGLGSTRQLGTGGCPRIKLHHSNYTVAATAQCQPAACPARMYFCSPCKPLCCAV
jgi:hypothetical protein